MNNWKCSHLDYVLDFTQSQTEIDAYLKTLSGCHIEDEEGNDTSEEYCLKVLKNCYGTKDAAANCFTALQKALEDRGFRQCADVDPCLFTRDNCVIITCVDDCLIFHKNDNTLKELIASLEIEFKLTNEGDLVTF